MRKHRLLRIIGIIVSIVAAAAGAGILAVAIHPQLAVGGIQKLMYQKNPVNTYAPLHEPSEGTTESGLYVTVQNPCLLQDDLSVPSKSSCQSFISADTVLPACANV